MSDIRGFRLFGMRTTIHVDDAKTVRPADIEDEHALKIAHLDNLETVSCPNLTWTRRGLAAGVWRIPLEVRLTVLVQGPRPGLKRNIHKFQIRREGRRSRCDDTFRIAGQLRSSLAYPMSFFTWWCTQVHTSIRTARCWTWRGLLLPTLTDRRGSEENYCYRGDPQFAHWNFRRVYIGSKKGRVR